MNDLKDHITIEINGQKMPADTFKVVKFLTGDIKIVAVFHDAPGYCKEEENA